jgi:hypothetical protein
VSLERIVLVNKRTGLGHLHRDCEAIENVPDGALRIYHHRDHALPPLRLCQRCFPPRFPAEWMIDQPDVTAPCRAIAAVSSDAVARS